MDMDPAVMGWTTDKGKDLFHHILSQTIRTTITRLMGRQMIILLFILTFLHTIRSIILHSAQCTFCSLGHNPDIKQRLFPCKLINSPQRDTASLSESTVSKSNELVVDNPLSEYRHCS